MRRQAYRDAGHAGAEEAEEHGDPVDNHKLPLDVLPQVRLHVVVEKEHLHLGARDLNLEL